MGRSGETDRQEAREAKLHRELEALRVQREALMDQLNWTQDELDECLEDRHSER